MLVSLCQLRCSQAFQAWRHQERIREALEGWKKERERPEDGVHEYTRAVEMFIELHGNLAIAEIRRSHATQFREALRQVPKTRKGTLLLKAGLLELRQWSEEHPGAPKVSAGTVNKQLGAVQTDHHQLGFPQRLSAR